VKVSVRQQGQTTILDVDGQITFESTPVLREHILQTLKGNVSLLVNLTKVAYMDSSGIATLVEGLKEAQSRKAGFGLFGLTKNTRNVLRLVRLDRVFRIFETEADALLQFNPSA
jgi:anti-sigma B factor antagonist